jgi:Rod binding domain-containing protein
MISAMPAVPRTSAADLATWTVGQTVRPSRPAASADSSNSPDGGQAIKKAKEVAQQFEAIYLRQMVEASMPKDSETLFGAGTSGTMWRSMYADTLATALSKTGTVGIANMILKSEMNRLKEK